MSRLHFYLCAQGLSLPTFNITYVAYIGLAVLVIGKLLVPLSALNLFLVLLQTPTDNYLVKQANDSGLFAGYSEAKRFVNVFTGISIAAFMGTALWAATD